MLADQRRRADQGGQGQDGVAGQGGAEPLAQLLPDPVRFGRFLAGDLGCPLHVAPDVRGEPVQVREQVRVGRVGLDVDGDGAGLDDGLEVEPGHVGDLQACQRRVDGRVGRVIHLDVGRRPDAPDPRRRVGGGAGEAGVDQPQAELHRGHVGAERAHRVQGGSQRVDAVEGYPAPGGLQAGDPAAGRRDPHRTAGIGAEGHVRLPRRDRHRRAARGPAGYPPGVQRVRRGAQPRVDPAGRPAQLGQAGLADDPRPGSPGRRHHGRVPAGRGRLLRDRLAAGRRRQALDVDAVLDGQARPVAGRVQPHHPDGVHGG